MRVLYTSIPKVRLKEVFVSYITELFENHIKRREVDKISVKRFL